MGGGARGGGPAVTLPALLLGASLLLAAFSAAGILAIRAEQSARRLQARRGAIMSAYRPADAPVQASARLSASLPAVSVRRRMKQVLGMDPERRDPYPLQPVLVVPLSAIPGYIVHWLLHGLLGHSAWMLVPVVMLFVTRSVYSGNDAKRTAILYRQFPDALATIVRAVRVGIPVTEALRAVAQDAELPTSVEFARLHDQVSIGTPMEDALREMAARNRLPEYRFFATALALQAQTGGGLTETLENLADVVRKRVALKARGYALASEARTSAGVLAALPVFSGLALMVMNPDYIGALFEEGPGQTLFGCTVLWLGLGIAVMRSMIRRSLS